MCGKRHRGLKKANEQNIKKINKKQKHNISMGSYMRYDVLVLGSGWCLWIHTYICLCIKFVSIIYRFWVFSIAIDLQWPPQCISRDILFSIHIFFRLPYFLPSFWFFFRRTFCFFFSVSKCLKCAVNDGVCVCVLCVWC